MMLMQAPTPWTQLTSENYQCLLNIGKAISRMIQLQITPIPCLSVLYNVLYVSDQLLNQKKLPDHREDQHTHQINYTV